MSQERPINIRDFTRTPLKLLSSVGIKLFKWHPLDSVSLREKITLFFIIINAVLNITAKIFFFILKRGNFESPIELTEYAVYFGFMTNSLFKIFTIIYGRKLLKEVLMEMDRIFPSTDNEIVVYNLEAYYGKTKRCIKMLTVFHLATNTMFSFFPIAQSLVEYTAGWSVNGRFEYRFPFLMTYPFDEKRPLPFCIAYLGQALAGYMCSCFFLGSDLLLIAMVHHICMHFEYLANKIKHFVPHGSDEDIKELKDFIIYHENILQQSFKINQIFNVTILLNFIATCGVTCLIGFQLTVGSDMLDLLKFFFFLTCALTHVYFICYFGTNLLHLSTDIADAVCQHNWYLGSVKYQKMLPLIVARSQKPAFITAFKFFIISMESFKTLVTTSYQFFTLIKTRYDEQANMS